MIMLGKLAYDGDAAWEKILIVRIGFLAIGPTIFFRRRLHRRTTPTWITGAVSGKEVKIFWAGKRDLLRIATQAMGAAMVARAKALPPRGEMTT